MGQNTLVKVGLVTGDMLMIWTNARENKGTNASGKQGLKILPLNFYQNRVTVIAEIFLIWTNVARE